MRQILMKCESVTGRIDDYLDGDVSQQERQAMAQHLRSCESCRAEYQSAQNLLEQLNSMDTPIPRAGYESRVLEFLNAKSDAPEKTRQHRPRHMPIWFAAGFSTAALAIFALLFIFNSPSLKQNNSMPVMTVELQPLQTRKVDLVFNSPTQLQNAQIKIELPQGTEIAGYPNRGSLEWKTSFKQGSNKLSLPLIVKEKSGGTLYATITHEGQTRIFELNLVAIPASSHYTATLTS